MRRRGPAGKKDDAEDARICCLLAPDRHAGLKRLIPHGVLAGELRADLLATFPAALTIVVRISARPGVLRLLERWPPKRWRRRAGRRSSTSPERSTAVTCKQSARR